MNTKTTVTTFCSLLCFFAFSQGRLVISSAFVVIDNSAKVVIENPATNAIDNSGFGGIMTENEFDQVVWRVGTTTGAYVLPWVSRTPIEQIPFTATITSAGVGSGVISFSTYPALPSPDFDNFNYRPTDVTHMGSLFASGTNNSDNVIDRFWINDAVGYTTKPTATFQFMFRDIEHTQTGNTIVESNLGAQRFNTPTGQWGDYLPQGTTNAATNTTSSVPVSPANFFRSWTLSEIDQPLAADFAYFKANCNAGSLELSWETTAEVNVSHFEVEHYENGQFVVIGFVQATGSSSSGGVYSFQSAVKREGVFRLVEVDSDGNRTARSTLSANCNNGGEAIVSYQSESNALVLSFDGEADSNEELKIYDATGKIVFQVDLSISKGSNTIVVPDIYLSTGAYLVRLRNGQSIIANKIGVFH